MNIKTILFLLSFICLFTACSKDGDGLDTINFGSQDFEEPFIGPIKTCPSILTKSLYYPPFSWFSPDTISFKETIRLEDTLIINQQSKFYVVNDKLNQITGVRIKDQEGCYIDYYTPSQNIVDRHLYMDMIVDPSLGDTVLSGYILMENIDTTTNEVIPTCIAKWKAEQEIGWPCILWLLWITCAILAIGISCFVLFFLGAFIYYCYPTIKTYVKNFNIKLYRLTVNLKDKFIHIFTNKKYKKIFYQNSHSLQRKSQVNKHNEFDGEDIIFYKDGGKNKVSYWNNGVRDGAFVVYWPNGKKYIEGYYSNGILKGKYTVYSEKQDIIMQKEY